MKRKHELKKYKVIASKLHRQLHYIDYLTLSWICHSLEISCSKEHSGYYVIGFQGIKLFPHSEINTELKLTSISESSKEENCHLVGPFNFESIDQYNAGGEGEGMDELSRAVGQGGATAPADSLIFTSKVPPVGVDFCPAHHPRHWGGVPPSGRGFGEILPHIPL